MRIKSPLVAQYLKLSVVVQVCVGTQDSLENVVHRSWAADVFAASTKLFENPENMAYHHQSRPPHFFQVFQFLASATSLRCQVLLLVVSTVVHTGTCISHGETFLLCL